MSKSMTTLEDFFRSALATAYEPFGYEEDSKYPPHNIQKTGDERYRLTLAVAGFSRDDIEVSLLQNVLYVKGSRTVEENPAEMLHQGIGFRDFRRKFRIDANTEISGVRLDHGLLIIDLERRVPEAEKPRLIEIT
jgi:molecular chaperone IbpA